MREITTIVRLAAICTLLGAHAFLFADSSVTTRRTMQELGPGIYEIRHPDAPDGFPQSNTLVVIGEKGVLVVDSCLLPSTAREDVAQIRQWTSKPVTFLVNTHWHFDHTLGNAVYAEAFPGLQIVAHRHTQQVVRDFNPGAVARYPNRAQTFKKILESGKDQTGKPLTEADRRDYEKSLAGLAPVVAEMKNVVQVAPTLAFDHELDIDLGGRLARVMFLGKGNTAGDTVVFLPREKIVAAGDMVVHPVPYFFGGFPVDLVSTLDKLATLDADTIVPGHGDVLRDKAYIKQVRDMVAAVNHYITRQVNEGKTLEQVQESYLKDLDVEGYRQKLAGTDRDSLDMFDQSFPGLVRQAYTLIKAR